MPLHQRQTSSASGRKSVLFCPSYGHESPVDGDWQVQARGDDLVYGCPACEAVVTVRPTGENMSPVSSSHEPSAGGSLLARSVQFAFAWAAWPCTPAECALQCAAGLSAPTDASPASSPAA